MFYHIPNDITENIREILYESRANIVKSRVVGQSWLRRKCRTMIGYKALKGLL